MKWIPLLVTAAVSGTAGWIIRWQTEMPGAPQAAAADVSQPKAGVPVEASIAAKAAAVAPPDNAAAGPATLKQLSALASATSSRTRSLAALIPVIDGWSAEQVKNAAAAVLASSDRGDSRQDAVREVVLSRLAEIDPKGAVSLALSAKGSSKRSALNTIFGQLALTNLDESRKLLNTLSASQRKDVIPAMAGKLAELNPQQAIALMNSEHVPPGDFAWHSLYRAWGARDPEGLAQMVSTLPDGPQRYGALHVTAEMLAIRDPEQALAWAKTLSRSSESQSAIQNVFQSLSNRDPEQALKLISQQPAREQRELMRMVGDAYVRNDPEKGIAWLRSLEDKTLQQSLIASISSGYAAWARPEETLKLIDLLPPGKARRDSIGNMAGTLAFRDPDQALEWMKTLSADDRQSATERIIWPLGWNDPAKAAALAKDLMPTQAAMAGVTELAASWAQRDPMQALTWAFELETEKMRKDATARIFQSWADSDPEKAAEASRGIDDPNSRRQTRTAIAEAWARKSPKEAMAWAETLPPEDRYGAMATIWSASATDDPAKSGRELAEALPNAAGISSATDGITNSAGVVSRTWAAKSPDEAAEWAAGLTEGKARDAALAGVAAQWAETDQVAASKWVDSLPPGSSRDEAVSSLVNAVAASDPDAAFQWAASVSNSDKQYNLLKNTLTTWKSFNPSAARQAVQSASISDEMRAKLMDELK